MLRWKDLSLVGATRRPDGALANLLLVGLFFVHVYVLVYFELALSWNDDSRILTAVHLPV